MAMDNTAMDREWATGWKFADEADVLVSRDESGAVPTRMGRAQTKLGRKPVQRLEGTRDIVPDIHVAHDIALTNLNATHSDLDHRAPPCVDLTAAQTARACRAGNMAQ